MRCNGKRLKIDRDQGWATSRTALLYRLRNTADLLVGMNAIQLALRGKQDLAFSPPVTFVNRYYSSSNHPVRGAQLSFQNNSKILALRPVPDLLANTSHPSRLLLNAGYRPVEMKRASSKSELCIEDVARITKILGGANSPVSSPWIIELRRI